ncbi:MAG: hypothetical protein WCE30_17785 [Mycobacterium sp.]
MADEVLVRMRVYRGKGKLAPAQVRDVFAALNTALSNPDSEASKEVEALNVQVRDVRLDYEPAAFVAETFLITFVLGPLVAGAAEAAGKAVFEAVYENVIKRAIRSVSDNGVTKAEPIDDEDGKDGD